MEISMKKKMWEIQVFSMPNILRYCKKCGKKMLFTCSGQFRVNAQRKYLDIWLIYKCSKCNATWNATVYSRISPQSLNPHILDGFYKNDKNLIEKYAMDSGFLQKNKVEIEIPQYLIAGDSFSLDETVELEIKSKHCLPMKISSLVKEKLHISQKEYLQLISDGKIKSIPNQDLQKSKLKNGIVLIFNEKTIDKPAE